MEKFPVTFTEAGDYEFQCDPHAGAGMKGVIHVQSIKVTQMKMIKEKSRMSYKMHQHHETGNQIEKKNSRDEILKET